MFRSWQFTVKRFDLNAEFMKQYFILSNLQQLNILAVGSISHINLMNIYIELNSFGGGFSNTHYSPNMFPKNYVSLLKVFRKYYGNQFSINYQF